ncbi:molecular chaperone HtpG [Pseudomonadota bacterium]|nr:molecular chaperone HtpG [Pseudomonadota bacterium]
MAKTKKFQTETTQLLQLMIHSLYSNKEVFVRELISNASDALDKLRFRALTNSRLAERSENLGIKIELDEENSVIKISDNGIGMNEDEIVQNLGTIARSGTSEFLKKLTGDKKKDSNLIGQFGVGFYSAFMVAKKVVVISKSALSKSAQAIHWESSGDEKYILKEVDKETCGTDVIVYLKEENKNFTNSFEIKNLISKYSQYINFPIRIDDAGAEVTLNEEEALWLKPKNSLSDEEYNNFYKFLTADQDDPLVHVHNRVEGNHEYTNLLYIPKHAPFDLWNRESPRGIKLYVQRVFIMDDAEHFLPLYLRFVRGVIDSNDLPLNVSREILQDHPLVGSIKKASTKRILDALQYLKDNAFEEYLDFWNSFGLVLKEGPAEDFENREAIASLMLFATSRNETHEVKETLDDYLQRMPSDQNDIYFCVADTFEAAINSPHLEKMKAENKEVLLLTDRIDEWLMTTLVAYKDKPLVNVAKSFASDSEKPKPSKTQQALLEKIKLHLGDRVSEVLPSSRLKDSACCLVLNQNEPGIQLRKILEAAGQKLGESVPIFEINMTHKLIKKLKDLPKKEFNNFVDFLFDYAVIAEGGSPKNPSKYLRQLDKYLSAKS